MVEIGTGFGYSALWIAAGAIAARSAEAELFTVDDHSEGELGYQGLRFAREICQQANVSRVVRFVHGRSPDVLKAILEGRMLDFAFIDGNHHGGQPYADFHALSMFTHKKSIIAWHDVDTRYTVPDAFERACSEGWTGQILNTSCRLGVSFASQEHQRLISDAFEAACRLALLNTSSSG